MTRKHYIALAACINDQVETAHANEDAASVTTLHRLADCMARTLKSDNSRFDRSRFLTACGFDA